MEVELTPEIRAFIAAHSRDDPASLALQQKRYPELPMAFIAQQIKGRQRIEKKLPLWHGDERAHFPASLSLEQCSSEALARYKARLVAEGGLIADLTGGFGVDALFFARRSQRCHYVELDAALAGIAARNFMALGVGDRVEVHAGDGLAWLESREEAFDCLYIDPARRDARSLKVSALSDCEPDVVAHWGFLLSKAKTVMLKASPGLDIEAALGQLAGIKAIYVLSLDNECKETLCCAEEDYAEEPRIHCVNMHSNGRVDEMDFLLSEEKAQERACAMPGRYLYEPNASIMKAGAFKTLSQRTGYALLHSRTRLLSADTLDRHFPGRVFEIEAILPLSSKAAKQAFPDKQANAIARNCGLSTDELKRKLGLRDGGGAYAFGVTLADGSRRLLRCSRIG